MAYFDKYGVEFSDDRKTLVKCPDDFQGEYVIPDGVTNIGNYAFASCHGMISVRIPESITGIGYFAFAGCTGLTSVKIPDSVTSIGDDAFCECRGLTSINLPNSVTSIGCGVFCLCSKLTSPIYNEHVFAFMPTNYSGAYTIPYGIKSIGVAAFACCHGLTSVTIPNSVTHIEDGAFTDCTGLISVKIPNSVKSIEDNTFSGCSSLTSIEIPNSVTRIGGTAFSNCTALTSVTIPISVASVGKWAFNGCTALNSATIPDSAKSIEGNIFEDCTGLTAPIYNARIFVSMPITHSGGYTILDGIESIIDSAFKKCTGLTSVTIPNSVTSIGSLAFEDCSGLTSMVIPNSVTSIGFGAFWGCKGLTSITIPNSVTSIIGYEAFRGCSDLKEICVPKGQKARFCDMQALKNYVNMIREISIGKNIGFVENPFSETAKHRVQEQQKQKEMINQREAQEQRRMQEQQMQEMLQDSILFFDTETTGVPKLYNAPVSNSNNWPRLVQLAWLMADKNGNVLKKKSVIIKPSGFTIPSEAAAVHGITTERAQREGQPLDTVMEEFMNDMQLAASVVGHNIDFDMHIVGAELYRLDMDYDLLMDKPCTCTMKCSTDFCAIPNPNTYFGGYKWPSLQELYRKLFGYEFTDAHDALADISATKDCFFELKRRGVI